MLETAQLRPLNKSVFAVSSVRELQLSDTAVGDRSFLSPLEKAILKDASKTIRKVLDILEADGE